MILCKDCKYHKWRDCIRVKRDGYTDVVTGRTRPPVYPFCSTERDSTSSNRCGIEAKFFEPKKKLWKIW